jgi:hypothetical protein
MRKQAHDHESWPVPAASKVRASRRTVLTVAATGLLSACTNMPGGGGSGLHVSDAPIDVDERGAPTLSGVRTLLARRLAALKTGDEKKFLADLDPSNKALVAWQKRLFANLRQFHFTHLDFFIKDYESILTDPDGFSKINGVQHLLQLDADSGPAGVHPGELYTYTLAVRGGRLMILDIKPYVEGGNSKLILSACAAPWNLQELAVAHVGTVTVAAPPTVTGLQKYAQIAAQEARTVTRLWGKRPTFPGAVLFLAPDEATFGKWYRLGESMELSNADGVSVGASRQGFRENGSEYVGEPAASRVVVNMTRLLDPSSGDSNTVSGVIRHELVHALTAKVYQSQLLLQQPMWAIEGFARYVEDGKTTPRMAASIASGVRSGWFSGLPPYPEDFYGSRSTFNYDVSASLFCFIAARKGQAAAVEFYAQLSPLIEAKGESVMRSPRADAVARRVVGMPAQQLLTEWGRYVRSL